MAETLDVIERVGFDNAYTFIYSPRRGTPAAAMKDQVPAEEVKVNFDKVLSAVQRNAAMRAGALTGRIMEGLVEEVNERKEGYVTCRLSNNMVVHIPGDASMIGSYKPILLEQCRGFYFFGRIADTDSAVDPQEAETKVMNEYEAGRTGSEQAQSHDAALSEDKEGIPRLHLILPTRRFL